ncbi:transcription initiation factor 4F subunit [Nosema bombycis CQ1]|uniref:Transcription initiation factor 4F subunit n=1 Tax=Nosema bombycis (strain CQ1 / CVCC 102059) TaxID=578461 RepID=R0MLR5_NOSB1|nr:transcription initiation factor 4F subunit [Nosema bombycis CQ1]|eukprot:EOB15190.1 transcription initiation factor 4F subunit [Nosema bombycis CQ1]
MNTRTDNNEVIKRVIYKNKKPKMVIVRRIDAQYLPRVKSAPPISIPEPVPEKKHVLLKADGTPLTIEDLDDITDSSTSSSFEEQDVKELKDVEKEKAIESVEVKAVEVKDKESDMEKDMKQKEVIKPKELPTVKLTCDRCKYGLEERTEMLEELLKEFPPIIRKFIPIAEILSCKERASFDLKLMKKVKAKPVSRSTYVVDKNRKDTAVELARLELNKLTASNFNTVVSKLKALNIEKVDESKEIASILLDKATSEPTFVKLYAKVVGELKKVLRSKEELAMKIKQTAFFGTLLTKAFAIVNDKIEWADPKTVINLKDFPNRFAYEEKIEEMEEKRYKKKAKTVGAITFVSQLYIDNIISLA